MREYPCKGYIRLLTAAECHLFFSGGRAPRAAGAVRPPGMVWLRTRLGLVAEARNGSLEHRLLIRPIKPPIPLDWPASALYLYAETLFLAGDYWAFTVLMLARAAAAELLTGSDVYWCTKGTHLAQAKDMVRVAYAAQAAKAALEEIAK